MKELLRNILYITLVVMLLNMASVSAAVDTPRIEPYVNDFVGLLNESEVLALNLLSDSIEVNTTYEIAVVIVPTTGGDNPVVFANKIGDLNGVGKKDLDNGIVVLWSIENEHGGAIAVGRGAESILNDAKVGTIGREARPLFDEGKYYEGFIQIVNAINIILEEDKAISTIPVEASDDDLEEFWFIVIIGTLICIFFFIGISSIINADDSSYDYVEPKKYIKRKGKDGKYRYYTGTGRSYSSAAAACAALALLSDDSYDSDNDDDSSSSSFSGSSFGGGSFGGGGVGF